MKKEINRRRFCENHMLPQPGDLQFPNWVWPRSYFDEEKPLRMGFVGVGRPRILSS